MIASLMSALPNIITIVLSISATWLFCRFWYTTRYIHRSEVRPLQESQHIMQNQYAILAERIKHTESQLAETKSKLETVEEREQALLRLKESESKSTPEFDVSELSDWGDKILDEIKKLAVNHDTGSDDVLHTASKDQFNYLRQTLKELKIEFSQKFNVSTNQYHELSNQLWQLIELNKKLTTEADQLSQLIQNGNPNPDEAKTTERPFTLASIKKRS